MTGNHVPADVLTQYGSDDRSLLVERVDVVERHLLECESCRLAIADTADPIVMDRSWSGVLRRVRAEGADGEPPGAPVATTPPEHPVEELPDRLGSSPGSRRRLGPMTGIAAAVVLVVLVAALLATRSGDDARVASTDADGWTDLPPPDADVLRGAERPIAISAIVDWGDELVVVTADDPSGSTAWIHSDEHWERRAFEPPAGCDPNGGLVALGELLTISCIAGDRGEVFVASTRDLQSWSEHDVADAGPSFGTSLGRDADGGLTVVLLEAADPNTTFGATVRVWEGGLESWREVTSEGDGFVDAAPQRIRAFDGRVVITGAVNEYPSGPTQSVVVRPAIWVSDAPGPFERTMLPEVSADAAGAWAFDVSRTIGGYVAVGGSGDGTRALAWTSPDLVTWTPSSIPQRADPTGREAMWSVATTADGTLLASGIGSGTERPSTRSSIDGGRTWQLVDAGPALLARWNGQVVGALPGAVLRVLQWNPQADAARPETTDHALVLDLGAAGQLPAGGTGVLHVPPTGDREALFVLRDDEERLVVLSARSPKQGCRLVDVDGGDLDIELGPDVQFHDPCHGSNFDREGALVGGPGARGMYRYEVVEDSGRILVDLALAHPGPARAGLDLADPGGRPAGTNDATASRWATGVTSAAAEVRGDQPLPFIWVLGRFHDQTTAIVTIPFTIDGRVGTIVVGPTAALPPHQDSAPRSQLDAFRIARGTVHVDDGGAGSATLTARMDLPDGDELRVRVDSPAGSDAVPAAQVVALIDRTTRRLP